MQAPELQASSALAAPAAAVPAPAPPKAAFNATYVAYYFGGFLIIGAMTFFMAEGWALMGSGFVLAMAVIYAIGLWAIGRRLYRKPETRTPGGILLTAAVCMMPLAIYAFEDTFNVWQQGNPGTYSGFYTWVRGSWIWMELGTIAASAVALRFYRFPLLTLPAAFALWFLSMDCAGVIFRKGYDLTQAQWVSLVFGIVMIAVSIAVDRRTKEDFAFWGYLYGTLSLFCGLTLLWTDQLHQFFYLLVSLAAIALSILLGRRVLLIFGTLGVAGYLGQLAWDVFNFSLVFPFVVTFIGLAIVFAGIWYQRNEAKVRARILAVVPPGLVAMLPTSRAL